MTVTTHFCSGKISSVHALPFLPKENSCGCEDSTIPDDCCKTEIKLLQLSDEQIAVQSEQPFSPQAESTIWADASFEVVYFSNAFRTIIPTSSPPESPRSYILHCTLLI
jgi:hypothetical protein